VSTAPRLGPLPEHPRVSAVVPVRDGGATIEACLRSVLDQDPPVDEVVVAVGPSRDDTREVVESVAATDPRVRVVDNPSGRTPDALNAAIAASTGEVIVRVDAQSVLPPGYAGTVVDTLRRTRAANVGGRQVPSAERGFPRGVAAAMRSPYGSGGAAYRTGTRPGPVDTVYLGAFRREALEAVGGFDPRFVRNQDAELNVRLREAGYLVWFEPSLEVAYQPRATVGSLASQYLQYGRWRRLTLKLHPGSLAPRQLAAPMLVVAIVLAAVLSIAVVSWWPLLAVVAPYVAITLYAAAFAAPAPVAIVPTAVAFPVMHLAWGVGFLLGPPRVDDPPPAPPGSDA
jgi:succinoglycan biosynthesis protein ExoA